MWIIIYCILSRSHVFLYSPNPLPAMSLYWLRYCSLYDTTCINVYRPSEMTEFSAMVYPISKAALTATASARTVELAKPRKPRGGSDKWIDAAPCIRRLLYIISYIRCVEESSHKVLCVQWLTSLLKEIQLLITHDYCATYGLQYSTHVMNEKH